jgi:ferric-dicitrate binding protein FerR (iron transport regulator)
VTWPKGPPPGIRRVDDARADSSSHKGDEGADRDHFQALRCGVDRYRNPRLPVEPPRFTRRRSLYLLGAAAAGVGAVSCTFWSLSPGNRVLALIGTAAFGLIAVWCVLVARRRF